MASITRLENRFWHRVVWGLLVLSPLGMGLEQARLSAVEPPRLFPFPNRGFHPQEFLEGMFDPLAPEERERLERIEISVNDERQWG